MESIYQLYDCMILKYLTDKDKEIYMLEAKEV
jgi:hypothetical protein